MKFGYIASWTTIKPWYKRNVTLHWAIIHTEGEFYHDECGCYRISLAMAQNDLTSLKIKHQLI